MNCGIRPSWVEVRGGSLEEDIDEQIWVTLHSTKTSHAEPRSWGWSQWALSELLWATVIGTKPNFRQRVRLDQRSFRVHNKIIPWLGFGTFMWLRNPVWTESERWHSAFGRISKCPMFLFGLPQVSGWQVPIDITQTKTGSWERQANYKGKTSAFNKKPKV